jgi:hypothetical protein
MKACPSGQACIFSRLQFNEPAGNSAPGYCATYVGMATPAQMAASCGPTTCGASGLDCITFTIQGEGTALSDCGHVGN